MAPKETSDWQKFQLGVSEEALYDDVKLSVTALRYRKMLEKRVRSVASTLGEQNFNTARQRIRFNTSFKKDEEEDLSEEDKELQAKMELLTTRAADPQVCRCHFSPPLLWLAALH